MKLTDDLLDEIMRASTKTGHPISIEYQTRGEHRWILHVQGLPASDTLGRCSLVFRGDDPEALWQEYADTLMEGYL